MEAVEARLFDGVRPVQQMVRARLGASGLELEGEGVSRVLAFRDLINLGEFGQELRVGYEPEPDLRLVLPKALQAALAAAAPHAFDRGRIQRRWFLLGAGLTVGALGVAAALFLGAPLLAAPLARATPVEIERQLGENVAAQARLIFRPCKGDGVAAAEAAIAPLVERLSQEMQPEHPIVIEFVRSPAPNALALPGGRVMLTSGLFDAVEQPDELAAVLAHEIGHVQARDGLTAAYRNAGLGLMLEAITGGTGLAQQIVLLGGQVVEAGHTRRQEARADDAALAALAGVGADPGALARAFDGLVRQSKALRARDDAGEGGRRIRALDFLASHPAIEDRIAKAQALAAAEPHSGQLLTPQAWETVRQACAGAEEKD